MSNAPTATTPKKERDGRPNLTFAVVDVETANASRASICQIGVTKVADGRIAEQWETKVDPEEWFDFFNVRIHGIREEDVRGAPILPELRGKLGELLEGGVLVGYSPFDRTAFQRAFEKYGLDALDVQWLDCAEVVRRAWPEKYGFSKCEYNLKRVTRDLGIEFKHHDAAEDAEAAAKVLLAAHDATGLDIPDWLERVKLPIRPDASNSKRRSGSRRKASELVARIRDGGIAEGQFTGEVIVFTGNLNFSHEEASVLAADCGFEVGTSVVKKTTMLVVGVQRASNLAGYSKSRKHRKAESLISEGQEIQILTEEDFLDLIKANS